MIDVIRKNKMQSLMLNIIIIFVVFVTIIINLDDYKQILEENNVITNKESLDNVVKENKKFVTLDLTNAKLTRFSIKNNSSNKVEVNTYKVSYGNDTLIIFLRENTAITDKVKGKLISPSNEELEIKDKLKEELPDENIIDTCFSNVDYLIEELIIKLKLIVSIIFIILLFILSLFDIFYFIKPRKTRRYRNYIKF